MGPREVSGKEKEIKREIMRTATERKKVIVAKYECGVPVSTLAWYGKIDNFNISKEKRDDIGG